MPSSFISRVLGKREKLDKETLLDCLLEVAEERDLLALIFESMTEGVLVIDEKENLRFANSRAGELLSFNPARYLLKPMSSFLSNEEIADSIRGCLRTGEPVEDFETLLFEKEPRALRLEAIPVLDGEGRFGGVLVFLLETTEEKRREGELRESKRLAALATLSASLAHEIRNPLNSMGVHAQILERELKKAGVEDSLQSSAGVIREEITSLNEKLTQFLEASRPRQPQFEEVSVHDLVEETLVLMRPELEEAGVEPEYYPPQVRTTVFADRADLRKAFVNIIKNSLEAMPEGGRFIIRVRAEGSTVSIRFLDAGEGIGDETLERIFELGFTTKDMGSGLGLAQVDRCIREHYGTVDVDSHPDEGTELLIRLPVLTQGKRLLEHHPIQSSLKEAAPEEEKQSATRDGGIG